MKIAFVIPTYNRSNKIKKCIDSILDFRKNQTIEIHIIVCNNMSTDETESVLQDYSSNLNFSFYTRNSFEPSGHESLIKLLEELPSTFDWYWMMGDDDYIDIKNTTLFNSILLAKNIDYIHASSINEGCSEQLFIGSGLDLSEKYGLIGLFGFISSQIISNSALIEIKKYLEDYKLSKKYCFSHALLFYQIFKRKQGIVVNDNWVRNVDDRPSDGSGEPWFETAFYLNEAHKHGVLTMPLSQGFLISEKKLLWRNFICWLILYSFNTKTPISAENIKKVKDTIELCNDAELVTKDLLLFDIICKELEYIQTFEEHDIEIKNSILQNITNMYNSLSKPSA